MKYTEPGGIPAALPPYMQPGALPPGVTQAQIDASLAANPNASHGGYVGVGPTYDPVANTPIPAAAGGSSVAQLIHAMRAGYTPDYQALLASDPQLLQAQSDVRAQLGTAAASRKAATAKILAQLGIVPDFGTALNSLGLNSSYLGEDVDPTTAGLARQMTEQGLSTEAQLGRQHDIGVNSLVDALAARGVLRSGGLGVGLTSENLRDKGAHFDALRAALDAIGGAQGGYNQVVQGTAGDLRTAAEEAMNRQIQLHPAVAGSQVDATYDPATGLYKDSDGNLYNPDGTPTKVGASNATPVHPSNVAAPVENTQYTVPQQAVPAPAALPNQGSGPYIGSANGPQFPAVPAAVPHATIPAAPLPNQGSGPYIGTMPAAVPAVHAVAAPLPNQGGGPYIGTVPAATVVPPHTASAPAAPKATAWSNSVAKRLNMPGF